MSCLKDMGRPFTFGDTQFEPPYIKKQSTSDIIQISGVFA